MCCVWYCCLLYLCKVQLAVQPFFSSFFKSLLILFMFMYSKQVGFLWLYRLFSKKDSSVAWCLKTTLVSKTTSLKMRFLFMKTILKVTKASKNVKSRVLIVFNRFSIFTTCCYFCVAGNKIILESVMISSELLHHSRTAALTCVLTVINHMREKISIYHWELTLLYAGIF